MKTPALSCFGFEPLLDFAPIGENQINIKYCIILPQQAMAVMLESA